MLTKKKGMKNMQEEIVDYNEFTEDDGKGVEE